MTNRCEDYPCCGHTDGLPCDWTAPDYASDPHLLCDHESGMCDMEDDGNEDCDGDFEECPNMGCSVCWPDVDSDPMEDQWLDGSYEE